MFTLIFTYQTMYRYRLKLLIRLLNVPKHKPCPEALDLEQS